MLELLRSSPWVSLFVIGSDRGTQLPLDAIAVRESVEDRQPHIGHGKMSRQASVDDLNEGGSGALGMNQHADVIRRHIEETPGFNNLKPVLLSVAESTVMALSILPVGRLSAGSTVIWKNSFPGV